MYLVLTFHSTFLRLIYNHEINQNDFFSVFFLVWLTSSKPSDNTSSTTPLSFSMALWNCQSAVNKADFISAFSLQSTLSILGLTETWIRPEDSATPAALSNNFSFSHTPRQVGRGGGTGLLISNNWKYSTHSPLCNYNSFESHAITVMAPIKLQIVVIYRPPGQILAPS